MKASALIILLMDKIEKNGDLDVCYYADMGDRNAQWDVNGVEPDRRHNSIRDDDLVFELL